MEEVYEPFLIQEGFLNRTPGGRLLTPKGYAHLGLTIPDTGPGQTPLFESNG